MPALPSCTVCFPQGTSTDAGVSPTTRPSKKMRWFGDAERVERIVVLAFATRALADEAEGAGAGDSASFVTSAEASFGSAAASRADASDAVPASGADATGGVDEPNAMGGSTGGGTDALAGGEEAVPWGSGATPIPSAGSHRARFT